MPSSLRHYLALSAAILIWGFNYTPVKYSLYSLPPMVLAFFTSSLAALLLWLVRGQRIARELRQHRQWGLCCGIGLFGTFGFNSLMYVGLDDTTATNAALMMATMPIFGMLAGWRWHGERVTWHRVTGMIVSISGVGYLLIHGDLTTLMTLSINRGDLLILLGVVSLTTHAMCVKQLRQCYSTVTVVATQLTVGSLLFLPFAVHAQFWQYVPRLTVLTGLSILYIVVLRSLVANSCYAFGLRHVPVSMATVASNGTALVAALSAALLLDERLTMIHAIAGGLILGGVTLTAIRVPRSVCDHAEPATVALAIDAL